MHRRTWIVVVVCLLVGACVGVLAGMSLLGSPHEDDGRVRVAVSNTYLGCAVKDALGGKAEVVALAGAGACPGHFDLRPSQVAELRSCDVLVRFGFQQALEDQLRRSCPDLPVIRVNVAGGLSVPETYVNVLETVASEFVRFRPALHSRATRPVDAIGRVRELEGRLSPADGDGQQDSPLLGVPVVASRHQAELIRWRGMDVVAVLPAPDAMRPSDLSEAINEGRTAGVKLVVANRPEGRKLADAVAGRLGVEVVVLDNFPEGVEPGDFDAMVRRNVERLEAAWEAR
jgi:zinc transport system substrate-binding protein